MNLGRIGIRLAAVQTEDTFSDEGRRLLDRWIVGYRLVLLVLLVIVWDMVFKPGL